MIKRQQWGLRENCEPACDMISCPAMRLLCPPPAQALVAYLALSQLAMLDHGTNSALPALLRWMATIGARRRGTVFVGREGTGLCH